MIAFHQVVSLICFVFLFLFFDSCDSIDPVTTLQCHRRQYSYKVQQTDSEGRTCWDHINVMSCWGRCDSNEIADWKFPYKKSHHPVCLHSSTQERKVSLRNCDGGVDPETKVYTFQEAASCSCSFCRSSEASCEGLRYRGARRAPRQIKRGSPLMITSPFVGNPFSTSRFSNNFNPNGIELIELVDPSSDFQRILQTRLKVPNSRMRSTLLMEKKETSKRNFPTVGQIPFVDSSPYSNMDFLSFLDATFGDENEAPPPSIEKKLQKIQERFAKNSEGEEEDIFQGNNEQIK
ncbi:UNVERIFIED_CONTAM: hypothetical protein RMT77_000888 [Armadillidium vulgare]